MTERKFFIETNIAPLNYPNISNKTITIFGTGSVGSHLAYYLSKLSNFLILIDPENFEPHNLATHFSILQAIEQAKPENQAKVSIIKYTIDSFNPSAIVKGYQEELPQLSEDVRKTNIIVLAVDSIQARIKIARWIQENSENLENLEYIIDTGISEDGYNITVFTKETVSDFIKMLEGRPERQESQEKTCEQLRNIVVISALASHLIQVLAKLYPQS